MKFRALFEDALLYPFSDLKRFLEYAGLNLAYILVIFIFTTLFVAYNNNFTILSLGIILFLILTILIYGYQLRAIKSTIQGAEIIPPVNQWEPMFIDGLKLLLTGLIYVSLSAIIIYLSLRIPINEFVLSGNEILDKTNIGLLIFGIIILIFTFVLYFMATAHLAYKNHLKSAFEIREILQLIKIYGWKKYTLFLIIFGLIQLLIFILAALVNSLPIFGMIITNFTLFPYLSLFRSRSIALVYKETLIISKNTSGEEKIQKSGDIINKEIRKIKPSKNRIKKEITKIKNQLVLKK